MASGIDETWPAEDRSRLPALFEVGTRPEPAGLVLQVPSDEADDEFDDFDEEDFDDNFDDNTDDNFDDNLSDDNGDNGLSSFISPTTTSMPSPTGSSN